MMRRSGEWLLALCIISVQLLAPRDCEGLLVGARDLTPSSLFPPHVLHVLQWVEHTWSKCELDSKSREDVKQHFDFNHVHQILSMISGKNVKGASTAIEEGLPPKIRQNLLTCLSNQDPESVKNLPDGFLKAIIDSIRKDLTKGSAPVNGTVKASAVPPSGHSPSPAPKASATRSPPKPAGKPTKRPANGTAKSAPTNGTVKPKPVPGKPKSVEKPTTRPVPPTKSEAEKKNEGIPNTTIIGISVCAIAFLALFFMCFFMYRRKRSSKDDKPLLGLNNLSAGSPKSNQGNPIDLSKLGALPKKAEAGQDNQVKQSSQEGADTGQDSHVRLSSQEGANTVQNGHVELSSHEGANSQMHPVVYNSSAEPTSVMPHPAPPQPQSPAPPLKASAVPNSGPSPSPDPKVSAPPPPPKSDRTRPPPPAIPSSSKTRPQPPIKKSGNKVDMDADSDEAKTKLKPFFWDKVAANQNKSMVWDHLKAGSFQFSEDAIESLFGCNIDNKSGDAKKDLSKDPSHFIRILEPKKAQNLAISLRAIGVSPEEVCSAVHEGNELPSELIETLLKWVPSPDEELRLRLYNGELSQLGPCEQFLRAIIDIPYVYQRLDALLLMAILPDEASNAKESFATLEVAFQELRDCRLFLKLLEAVLKTGNRMNVGTFRGEAQAFKLDTLLKLSDVKGTDGKTTLLHFVVQEMIRAEGVRAARAAKEQKSNIFGMKINDLNDNCDEQTEDNYKQLGLKAVSSLGDELQNVRKAATLDADQLSMSVASLGHKLIKTNEFLKTSMINLDEDSRFHSKLKHFVEQSQSDVTFLLEQEKKTRSLVKTTVEYFHGSSVKDEGLRLFVVVRDFLAMLDKVCKEVKEGSKGAPRKTKSTINTLPSQPRPRKTKSTINTLPSQPPKSFDARRNLFAAIQSRRADSENSSSDEES